MAKTPRSQLMALDIMREHRITYTMMRDNREKVQDIVERHLRDKDPQIICNIAWATRHKVDVNSYEYSTPADAIRVMAISIIMTTIEQKLITARERRIAKNRRKAQNKRTAAQRLPVPRMRVASKQVLVSV